jgi:hypothetical protein
MKNAHGTVWYCPVGARNYEYEWRGGESVFPEDRSLQYYLTRWQA